MTVEVFNDLMKASTAADLNSPKKISNQVTRPGYMLNYLLMGMPGIKTVQGGTSIRSDLILDEVSTAVDWGIGQKFTQANPQVLSNSAIPWRFTSDFRNWYGPEILLNTAEMSKDARNLQYVDMQTKIDMRVATSLSHHLEDQCTALPNWATMEETSGLIPNSLLTFCNELPDGLYASYRGANGGDNKVEGISKVAKPNWDNNRVDYKSVGVLIGATALHLFDAFESLSLDMGYQQLPGPDGPKNSDASTVGRNRVCFTQKIGVQQYQSALRINQDYFRGTGGGLDPNYHGATFDGMPIRYVQKLDTAAVYPTSSDASQVALALGNETLYGTYGENAANAATTNQGARYHWYDFDVTQKFVHKDRYFHRGTVQELQNQIEAYSQPITMYHNNCCVELRKNGVIFPSADI